MKKLSIAVMSLILSGCGIVPQLSPVVTSEAYDKAETACTDHSGVRMVNQSIGIKYTVYCNDESKLAL